MYIYVHVAVGAHADQKRALDFQELELQVIYDWLDLGAETELSPLEEGMTGTINHRAISQLCWVIFNCVHSCVWGVYAHEQNAQTAE